MLRKSEWKLPALLAAAIVDFGDHVDVSHRI
jgi:hypothetical protein